MSDFEKDLQKYQRQLDKGFTKLRFDEELEQEFLAQFFERNLIKQRVALCIAFILLLVLAPLDYRLIKDSSVSILYGVVRLYLTWPLALIALLLSFTEFFKRKAPTIAFSILLIIGLGTSLVSTYGAAYGIRSLYEGTILIIFVGYLLAGLRFQYSLAGNTLIGISYLALSLAFANESAYDYHSYFFIFGALLIGGTAAYTQEYLARLGFLQRGALKNSAKIDPLTGLLNRRAINDSLETILHFARRERRYVSLLLVDVDYFKRFNDFYGHTEGDNALIQVAHCLVDCCRRSLDFAGRYGGEEFILVWYDTNPEESGHLTAMIREKVAAMAIDHQQSAVSQRLTLSGGLVTLIPTDSTSVQSLINKADELLYESKREGRDCISMHEYRYHSEAQPMAAN